MPTITLRGDSQREYARDQINAAPVNSVVSIRPPTRSNLQNSKMWSMIEDVRRAEPEGRRWTAEAWKCAFMHYLGWQVRFEMGLEGSGPFPIGYRSSHLTVEQMSELIECMYHYGARHGVEWREVRKAGFEI